MIQVSVVVSLVCRALLIPFVRESVLRCTRMTIGRLGVDGMGINTGKAAAATREQRHAVLPGPTLVLFVVIERLGMNETDINRGKAAAVTREQR